METERSYSPEIETQRERTSLREIFQSAKTKIVGQVLEWMQWEDKELKAEAETIKKSADISRRAGEFFRSLIPESLHQPKKPYEHRAQPSNIIYDEQGEISEQRYYRWLRASFSKKYYQEMRHAAAKSAPIEMVGPVSAHEVEGRRAERRSVWSHQPGGPIYVQEDIDNQFFTLDDGTEYSASRSLLLVKDAETGMILEMDQLLPNKFRYTPATLDEKTIKVTQDKNGTLEERVIPARTELTKYEGTKNSGDGFYATFYGDEYGGKVGYGDLTKKGGMLSLLHEVTHAWQDAYGLGGGRKNFEKFYAAVDLNLSLMTWAQEQMEAEREKRGVDFYQNLYVPNLLKHLKEVGAEVDPDQVSKPEMAGEQDIKVTSEREDTLGRTFLIQSDKLVPLVDDFAREERDAWAHAIRALRFLRREGIDLEPELKNAKDFKEVIDPMLNSYQRWLDKKIEFPETTKVRKFLNREAVKPAAETNAD